MIVLALALLVVAAMICILTMWQATPVPEPAEGRTAPRDPVREEVDRWMHDWVRGRA